MKIVIIGAGPAGSFAAKELAALGHQVDVFEEHAKIGKPLACTGIVTREIENFVDINPVLVNTVLRARIVLGSKDDSTPSNCSESIGSSKSIDVSLGKGNLVIDRVALDQLLCRQAKSAGARFHLNQVFMSNDSKNVIIKNRRTGKEQLIPFDILVGADGPSSMVAKSNGILNKRSFWVGSQALCEFKNDGAVDFFPDLGAYAWVVPENDKIARIGVCARSSPKPILDSLLKRLKVKKVIDWQGGLIPEYDPKARASKKNVCLIGDSASMVKATTGGGIVQSLIAARALAKSIGPAQNQIPVDSISSRFEKAWRKELSKDLWIHWRIRKAMDRFSRKDWIRLIDLFNQDRLKEVLERNDREYPSRFLAKIFIKEPRLLYFLKFIII